MFMYSIKGKNAILVIAAMVVSVVLITGIVKMIKSDTAPPTAKTQASESQQKASAPKTTAKTNEDRLAFIMFFGWEVEEEAEEILEVIIPKEFDQLYTKYNAIQKKQSFDLEKFAGKRCKRYSYIISNYPGAESEVRINLLVYKNKVIGGDVSCSGETGFTHGFALPQ